MSRFRWVLGGLLLLSIASTPLRAQSHALILFAYGGRLVPVTDLSETGDALSSGTSLGGGIGLQLGERSAVRGSFGIVESDYEGLSHNLSDPRISRTFIAVDLMFGMPTELGLAPYIYFGGGRVSVDPDDPSAERFAKPVGRLGTGVNLVPTNSFIAVFVEFGGSLYEFDRLDFEKLQLDLALTGGIALALPF